MLGASSGNAPQNEAQLDGDGSCLFPKLTGAMAQWKAQVGDLAGGIEHFLKVTRSYWPGLFHCYDIQGLQEQIMTWNIFLVSGDIINVVVLDAALASPTAVIRGSVQLVAAIATQLQAPRSVLLLFLGLLGSRSASTQKYHNNGFNSDNSDVLPLRIWRLWSRNFSS